MSEGTPVFVKEAVGRLSNTEDTLWSTYNLIP